MGRPPPALALAVLTFNADAAPLHPGEFSGQRRTPGVPMVQNRIVGDGDRLGVTVRDRRQSHSSARPQDRPALELLEC
jgi:hypothetical protein